MKVCVLTHTFPRFEKDTAAAFMESLCRGLMKAGNKVTLLIPFDAQFSRENDPYKIITYRYIWPKKFHLLGYSRTLYGDIRLKRFVYLLAPFLYFFGFLALWRLVRKEKPDVISAHWILPNGFLASLVSLITGVPFSVTCPGSDIFVAKKNWIFRTMASWAGSRAKAVLADSPQYLDGLKSIGVKPKYSEIIPYPVDEKKIKPIKVGLDKYRKKYGLGKGKLVILAVGRLVYKKGFNYLIQALPPIIKKYSFVRLIIVGDGDQRQEWENLARELKLNDYVVFTGIAPRDEIIYYYNLADIFVMPSIRDQAGNVDDQPVSLIEAMAAGKPVVATDFPGISLTVADKVNGFLVPEKGVKEISQALEKLISLPELRKKMGQKNRKIVEERLSIKSIGEKYTRVFEKIKRN